jgi:putative transposase
MIFKKTYKFRLKPTQQQRRLFANYAGARRWLFNRGLERKKKAYEEGKTLSYFDLNNELPLLKQSEETQWLGEIHSQVLQQALHDLELAYQHFFRRVRQKEKPGFPRFKSKGEKDSFRYPQGVTVKGTQAYLPRIGHVRFKKSREIEGVIKQTTIIEEAGKWYICFSCEIEKEMPKGPLSEAVGIDMGLSHYATLAIGDCNRIEKVQNPRFLKKHLSKLSYLSKCLSKKVLKSRNRFKAKRKLQRLQTWLKNCRQDYAHKLSTRVVKSHDIIGVESLGIASMLQTSQTCLARSIADAGWRQFLNFLKYKAVEKGKALIEVDRWFPSTQVCWRCKTKHHLNLSDRKLICICGLEIDRDDNSAINIKIAAIEKFKAAGMSVKSLWSCPT